MYDYDHGQAYGRTLTELAGEEVQGQPSSQLLRRLSEEDVLAIEAYDVQAAVLQQNSQVPYYWYPHYTATVVLAVAADKGLVQGYDEPAGKYLRPGDPVARERVAVVLMRAFEMGIMK